MQIHNNRWPACVPLAAALIFAYFVCYPQDLVPVLNPVEKVFGLTYAISPGLYAVIAIGILAKALVRIWGKGVGRHEI